MCASNNMNRILEHGSLEHHYINALMLLVATLCKSYSAFITHAWLPNTIDLCDSSTDGFMDILLNLTDKQQLFLFKGIILGVKILIYYYYAD